MDFLNKIKQSLSPIWGFGNKALKSVNSFGNKAIKFMDGVVNSEPVSNLLKNNPNLSSVVEKGMNLINNVNKGTSQAGDVMRQINKNYNSVFNPGGNSNKNNYRRNTIERVGKMKKTVNPMNESEFFGNLYA